MVLEVLQVGLAITMTILQTLLMFMLRSMRAEKNVSSGNTPHGPSQVYWQSKPSSNLDQQGENAAFHAIHNKTEHAVNRNQALCSSLAPAEHSNMNWSWKCRH